MAHESFEDDEVAKVLNASFVSIKVDREERPDVDEVYMTVCQAMTGSGGWPMTILMMPDKRPFFAGTYLPKTAAFGHMGLIELLAKVAELWRTDRDALTTTSKQVAAALAEQTTRTKANTDSKAVIAAAQRDVVRAYDQRRGGFAHAPKFPMPHYLMFLLNDWAANLKDVSLDMVETTLDAMYRGGIFDHVGGGFARYATDSRWLVPHFEKMLYDNAGLLSVYAECYAVTGKILWRRVAALTADYVLRDMQSPQGGFYSAEDADSEGEEGKFYVWDYNELKDALGTEELTFLEKHFGITDRGNFEGHNILNMIDLPMGDVQQADAVLRRLYDIREKRVHPFKDTKISASWNGMMIEALARAGAVMDKSAYIDSAKRATDFVLGRMMDNEGVLCGTYKDGRRGGQGFLADYANMVNALLTIYTVTCDILYLREAIRLSKVMTARFYDEDDKCFYMAAKDEETLILRPRDDYDGAMISGTSSAVMAMVRLAHLTGEKNKVLSAAIRTLAVDAHATPRAHIHFISALMLYNMPHRQVVIAAERGNGEAMDIYRDITRRFLPLTTVIFYDKSEDMEALIPQLADYQSDRPFAAYVCENFTCKAPVYSRDDLMHMLRLD